MISNKKAYVFIFGITGWLILLIMVWWAFLIADRYVWSYFTELYIELIAINLIFVGFILCTILEVKNANS